MFSRVTTALDRESKKTQVIQLVLELDMPLSLHVFHRSYLLDDSQWIIKEKKSEDEDDFTYFAFC